MFSRKGAEDIEYDYKYSRLARHDLEGLGVCSPRKLLDFGISLNQVW